MLDAPFEVDAPAAPAIKETATALAMRQVAANLVEFDAVEAGLKALEAKYQGIVFDVSTTKGMVEAKAARADIRAPRYAVQTAVVNAKKPLIQLGKAIAARLKA